MTPDGFHVLIVAPNFGTFGGCEAFMFRLAEELHAHQIPAIVCFKRVTGRFELDSTLEAYIDECPVPVHFVDRASRELWEQIQRADIVHGQNTSIDIALMARLAGKPLVLTVHGWLRQRWSPRGLLARAANALAHRRWYNSDFVWSKWEPNGKRPTSGKLPVISNLPEGIVPPSERKGFVFAGRWIENKGLEVLLEAYAAAELDRDAWPLTLLGRGPLEARVRELVRRLELEDAVHMPGFVSNEERNHIFRHAKWMVTPPHTDEDLGLTPIEARHVGVPSIITEDGGLPEAGGRYALRCRPADVGALRRALETAAAMDEDAYATLAAQTRQELLEYLQPMSVYIQHYRSVLEECNSPAVRPRSNVLGK